jgi:hypothetical protein
MDIVRIPNVSGRRLSPPCFRAARPSLVAAGRGSVVLTAWNEPDGMPVRGMFKTAGAWHPW